MFRQMNCLCQEVSQHQIGGDVDRSDSVIVDFFQNPVVQNIKVFGPGLIERISSQGKCALGVAV